MPWPPTRRRPAYDPKIDWPEGKQFTFTVFDDPDGDTVASASGCTHFLPTSVFALVLPYGQRRAARARQLWRNMRRQGSFGLPTQQRFSVNFVCYRRRPLGGRSPTSPPLQPRVN